MARNGFKIFDADTHGRPDADLLEPFLAAESLQKLGRFDLLGPDILMFGSDYPHGESWFPVAVETVLGWRLKEDHLRKLLWDNAVKYYRRYSE
jgi:predicted TIM-barrel fold metal-dependent hydrolase